MRVERQRAQVLGDALVALAGGESILGRLRAQERRDPRVLAARGETAAQLGPLAARIVALVLADEREQLGAGFEIARRLGEQRAQERRCLARLPGAVRIERGRPAARFVALGHGLRGAGELLERLRRLGMPAGPGE